MSMGLGAFGLSALFAVALCVHVVRTNQAYWWIGIIIFFPWLGGLVYFAAIILPGMLGGKTARTVGQAARDTLDPGREYRQAKVAYDDIPTVHNRMRLAQAAAGLGRHEEAERQFAEAAQGIHADDPTLLLGRANALVELRRFDEALPLLDRLNEDPDKGRTPQVAVALGRTFEGLGRNTEAETAYKWASERLPGLEGLARYAAFLARTERKDQAREIVAEIDRRVSRTRGAFRTEARAWRDLAAAALG